ncbi:hypothetical protein B0H13DRAFT_2287091 [Mycena leptocephala]|nr:hypothetical protein B0H13DRAFT_2287091 [Mycena leptocephala]
MEVDVPLDHHSLPLSVRASFPGASPGHKSFQILQGLKLPLSLTSQVFPLPRTMTASNHAVIPLEPSRLQEYVSCSFKPSASPPAPVPAHLKIRGTFKTSSSLQVYNIQAPQVLEPPDCFKMSHSKYPPVTSSGRGMSMSSPRREMKSTLAMPTPFFLCLVSDTGLRDVFQHLTPCVTYPYKLGDYCEGRWPQSRAGSKIINTAFNLMRNGADGCQHLAALLDVDEDGARRTSLGSPDAVVAEALVKVTVPKLAKVYKLDSAIQLARATSVRFEMQCAGRGLKGSTGPIRTKGDVRAVANLNQVVDAYSGAHGARQLGTLTTALNARLQTGTGGGERDGRKERTAEEGGSKEHGKDIRGEDVSARENLKTQKDPARQ